jgi:hypothetical protein
MMFHADIARTLLLPHDPNTENQTPEVNGATMTPPSSRAPSPIAIGAPPAGTSDSSDTGSLFADVDVDIEAMITDLTDEDLEDLSLLFFDNLPLDPLPVTTDHFPPPAAADHGIQTMQFEHSQFFANGTNVEKWVPMGTHVLNLLAGKIRSFDAQEGYYDVLFEDGTDAEFEHNEIMKMLVV